ncbi:nucleotidyltransferase family protein [Pseudopontixanthobacter vadosimaris]|uniref:nucleotidyltransferase family protein n=1 Tax=Pseudopontixanthobacter vadosimaris TaxID=2726450 RepID=UPI0014745DDF|nr:nucleotidyltransferase family protein [Pseudopontixanthobacter vadosimaris]
MTDYPITAIVLAGQRAGVVNPLATRAGVSHKCLVPICGKPLIAHVLQALANASNISEIVISVEDDARDGLAPVIAAFQRADLPIRCTSAAAGIVGSVFAAAEGRDGPFLVTTADNVMLDAGAIDTIRAELAQADAVFALATDRAVLAAHPEGQRNFYRFKDASYANCNIYGLADRAALRAAEIFREGGQFQANPGRMIRAFGLGNILLMRFGLITLPAALKRVSRKLGFTLRAAQFTDGALAIDVDNERTYAICEILLARRETTDQ